MKIGVHLVTRERLYIMERDNAMYKNNIWGEYTMYEFPSNQICIIDPFVIYI